MFLPLITASISRLDRLCKFATKTTDEGDILLARYGGSLGKVFRAHKGAYNVALAKVIKLFPEIVDDAYLFQYYLSHFYQDFCVKAASGRSAQAGFNRNDMETLPFPLPPLPEQQRIVARIESLFAKLDEVKEKAQVVVDGYEDRKAAILHKAFTGELTAKWRAEYGIDFSTWDKLTLNDCLLPMMTKKPEGELFRYIDIDSIDNKRQIVRMPKILKSVNAPSRARRAVETGNILFSMVRPYLKNIVLVDDNLSDCIASTGFYVCRCKSNILPLFLFEFLRSDDVINYLMQYMKGDNSPSIRKEDLLNMVINLPSLKEQAELCRELTNIHTKEIMIKDAAESVIDQIDTMKKSILARAFRGELGTSDPTDEPAIELLKKILQDYR